jgi:hypothetical protein
LIDDPTQVDDGDNNNVSWAYHLAAMNKISMLVRVTIRHRCRYQYSWSPFDTAVLMAAYVHQRIKRRTGGENIYHCQ